MTEEQPITKVLNGEQQTIDDLVEKIEMKGEKPKKLSKKERKALFRAKQDAKKEAERIKSERIRASRVMPEVEICMS